MHEIDEAIPAAPVTLPDFLEPALPFLDWLNARLHDGPPIMTPELARAMTRRQFSASNARARAELGWAPENPLRETLADTMETIRTLRRDAGRKI